MANDSHTPKENSIVEVFVLQPVDDPFGLTPKGGNNKTLEQILEEINKLEANQTALKEAPKGGRNTSHVRRCIAILEAELIELYDQALTILEPEEA